MVERRLAAVRVPVLLSLVSAVLAAAALGWAVAVRRESRAIERELQDVWKAISETREMRVEAPRAEVARLRAEVTRLAAQPASRAAVAGAEVPVLSPFMRHGRIDAEGLPGPVLSTLRQQFGDLPVDGASVKQSGGKFFFSTESKLADGRHLEVSVDQTGNIVRRNLEAPLESLEEPLQRAVLEALGNSPDPNRITEVFEDGKTFFRVQTKNPEQAATWTFAPGGDLLTTEIHRRKP